MKTPDNPTFGEHIGDLRIPYLEGILTPEEKSQVEEHLKSCSNCVKELEELNRWTEALQANKNAVCPEQWELFNYVRGGEDPSGLLKAHLEECSVCQEDAEDFAASSMHKGVPAELWNKMRGLSVTPAARPEHSGFKILLSEFAEKWSNFFRIPVLAASAIAATILVGVLVYQTERGAQPMVALSSVQWDVNLMGEPGPAPEGEPVKKDRLAVVISFKDSKPPLSQQRIDSLYRALKPTPAMLEHFDPVSPVELKGAVLEDHINLKNTNDMLKGLHEKLLVKLAVLIKLQRRGEKFSIEAELVDATTAKTLRKTDIPDLPENELSAGVMDAVLTALNLP